MTRGEIMIISKEEELIAQLKEGAADKLTDFVIKKPRRVSCRVNGDKQGEAILETARFLNEKLGVDHLCTITGVDKGEDFEALYHFNHNPTGILLSVIIAVPFKGGVIKSITPVIPGAVWYERELKDLFGVKITGVPEGNRYPLPDEFPSNQYPLRKDWSAAEYIETEEKNLCQK